MRILMPSIVDPEDGTGGAWTTTRGFVRLMVETRPDFEIVPTALRRLPGSRHTRRQVMSLARSFLGGLPAKVEFTRQPAFLDRVRQQIRDLRPSGVLLNGSELMWLIPFLPRGIPCILLAHNLEFQVFQSQLETLPALVRSFKGILNRDVRRLRQFEIDGMQSCRGVVFLSAADQQVMADWLVGKPTLVASPVFFDPPRVERPAPPDRNELLHVLLLANLHWWPNWDALQWFLRDIFPRCADRIHLHVAGPGTEPHARTLRNLRRYGIDRFPDRITAHGFVPSLDELFRQCHFSIVPVRKGGGVKVKMAESIYHRVPVVATRCSARGLPLDPDPAIVLMDDPDQWINFFRSERAREVSALSPSAGNAKRFTASAQREQFRHFLNEVMPASPIEAL